MSRNLVVVVSLFFAAVLVCHALPTASSDQVPIENWTYNALSHLAAKGLVPGMPAQRFDGDWQYNREQMAGFVLKTGQSSGPAMSEDDRALLSRLAAEYEPEIRVIAGDAAFEALKPYAEARAAILAGDYEARAVRSNGDDHLIGIYDAAGFGLSGRYLTADVTVSNLRRQRDGDAFSILDTAFVKGKTPNWEWEVGKDYLWWGPGYSGSLALSDNSPSFPMLRLAKDVDFGWYVGNVKISQFIGTFDDGGDRFYLVGRRWEKRFSKKLHVGLNETAKMSKAPNPLIFILPSIYLYEHIYLEDTDANFNAFLSIDASYQPSRRFEGYFDFLIDDMNAPSFLRNGNFHRPRKIGFLLGGYWTDILRDGSTDLRVEYIFTDPETYGATRPEFPQLAYTQDGFVIGHQVGGNSSAVFIRLDRRFGTKWAGAASYLGRVAQDSTGPNPSNNHTINLLLVRDLSPSFSLTARYESLKLPAKTNSLQLGASYAF
jgi:hypothetical protein